MTKQQIKYTPKLRKLRRECHILMDEVFGTKNAARYNWLTKRGYDQHMSNMNEIQLSVLKQELIELDEYDSNIYKKKRKWQQ